LELIKYYD
jgi:hypothetical protein